mgnify:CR=1 FL=1
MHKYGSKTEYINLSFYGVLCIYIFSDLVWSLEQIKSTNSFSLANGFNIWSLLEKASKYLNPNFLWEIASIWIPSGLEVKPSALTK